jgi:hypothetical protein
MEDSIALGTLHNGVQIKGVDDLVLATHLTDEALARAEDAAENVAPSKLDGRL